MSEQKDADSKALEVAPSDANITANYAQLFISYR